VSSATGSKSIYGFQYASVDNIRRFERLQTYKRELNGDYARVDFLVDDVNEISLVENYRSTQSILDFSGHSLTLPATGSEEDTEIQDDITSLQQRQQSTTTATSRRSRAMMSRRRS